jgi:hypothetical protein
MMTNASIVRPSSRAGKYNLSESSENAVEPQFSLGEAASRLPCPITPRTLRRWITCGVRGRKLAASRIGGRFFVKDSDLSSFVSAAN